MSLLQFNDRGIYCEQGDFYIDPWKPVHKAIITHGHSDHARFGHKHYLCSEETVPILKLRLGEDISVSSVGWRESLFFNGVRVSLHPAGHIIGSAQIRVEHQDEVWVVTGDYKIEDDGFSGTYEPLKCHHFITECTFGLPIYKWQRQESVFQDINRWWQRNQSEGKVTLLAGYSLGKAQRLIQGLDLSIGKIYTHGAVENTNRALRSAGVSIQPTTQVTPETKFQELKGNIVIAPPSALGSPWTKRFKNYVSGVASGWMAVRGNRRRRGTDRGFTLSDHIDWEGLNQAVEYAQPEHIYATHGFTEVTARWFQSQGYQASTVDTLYTGENDEIAEEA